MKTNTYRFGIATGIGIIALVGLLGWGALLYVLQSSYHYAGSTTEIPEKYQEYLPATSTQIIFRTQQGDWNITYECDLIEGDFESWMTLIEKEHKLQAGPIQIPDHSSDASEIVYKWLGEPLDKERFACHRGSVGAGILEITYDRLAGRLYLRRSRI